MHQELPPLEGDTVPWAELLPPHGTHVPVDRDLALLDEDLGPPPGPPTRLASFSRASSLMYSVVMEITCCSAMVCIDSFVRGGYGPFGWLGLLRSLGALRPGGPCLPGGGPHFSREMGERGPRGKPLDPEFYGPLAAARSFLGSLSLIRRRGYFFRYARTDLGRIFRRKICWKEFSRKKVSKSGHVHGPRNSPSTETMWHDRQSRTSEQRVDYKGGAGGHPRDSLRPGFL